MWGKQEEERRKKKKKKKKEEEQEEEEEEKQKKEERRKKKKKKKKKKNKRKKKKKNDESDLTTTLIPVPFPVLVLLFKTSRSIFYQCSVSFLFYIRRSVVTFELVGKGLNGIGGCYLQKIDV